MGVSFIFFTILILAIIFILTYRYSDIIFDKFAKLTKQKEIKQKKGEKKDE